MRRSFFWARWRRKPFVGSPVGDRIGRKYVIWCSILGVLPFTLMLPYASLFWTEILTLISGVVLASAILVYAQELPPGNVGVISGLFFGFAFGMGGMGAAFLGNLADRTSLFVLAGDRNPRGTSAESG